MAAESKEGEKVDARVNWVSERLQKAFTGIKADKFPKLFNEAESM